MSSGYASVRCIRCGAYTEGVQVCGDCTERQRAEESARAERVAQAIANRPANAAAASPSAGACPSCGRLAGPGANFCGFCRYEFRGVAAGARALVYAGFWIRLVALFIDGIILMIPNGIIEATVEGPGAQLLFRLPINALYFAGFWVLNSGATPGKMALGLKVQMANGEPIKAGSALLRWIGYYVSLVTLLIGFIMTAFTPQKRGLHDYIAGTVVVKTR